MDVLQSNIPQPAQRGRLAAATFAGGALRRLSGDQTEFLRYHRINRMRINLVHVDGDAGAASNVKKAAQKR